jgi:hypothetical protein
LVYFAYLHIRIFALLHKLAKRINILRTVA